MTLGKAPPDSSMFRSSVDLCDAELGETSIYKLLYRECHRLFPDEAFRDLYRDTGRASVPPRILAVVMVLQRLEGLSDREAVERFTFDVRWKYAAGGLDVDHPSFVHSVLVEMRARLRSSERPNRIFDAVLDVAKQAGLVGNKRVLDSTALYDAVATQDTVTMIRAAIRGVLRAASAKLGKALRAALRRDDDYEKPGKPACDWEDEAAREALVDALARDGFAVLARLDGKRLEADLKRAAELLAAVLGQDLETTEEGRFRIARRVAPDRIISTVDPEARHGHKTAARGFDGYKGHVAIDPDSEIITATDVTPGNAGDATAAEGLLADVLGTPSADAAAEPGPSDGPSVFGDASYGTAELVDRIEERGGEANVKVQPPAGRDGHFTKDAFAIDTKGGTVTCPAGQLVQIRTRRDGSGVATFGAACSACPLRAECTDSPNGRKISIHAREDTLARTRRRQADPAWKAHYRATRPKVERKIAHLMRRRHGGRRARVRGTLRVRHDFALLGAAINLQRLAARGVRLAGGASAA